MLNSKEARAKYVKTVLTDPQRPYVWEYFHPGTIPLAGECTYYDEVWLIDSMSQKSTYRFCSRNKGVHSNQYLCSEHFLFTSLRMGSKRRFPLLIQVTDSVQLVPWPLQLQL